jgi:hypothetical protein
MKPNSEKDFLHDISSPVSVLQGGLEMLRMKLKNGQISDVSEVEARLSKLINVSEKLVGILTDRKNHVKDLDD